MKTKNLLKKANTLLLTQQIWAKKTPTASKNRHLMFGHESFP